MLCWLLLILLICESIESLHLYGVEISFHSAEEEEGRRSLQDEYPTRLYLVQRNFTCLLKNETDTDRKNFLHKRGTRGKGHHQQPDYPAIQRGREFSNRKAQILQKDFDLATMVIDKETFVIEFSKYKRRKCDLVTTYDWHHKFLPPGQFPVVVKVKAGAFLDEAIVAGPDLWQVENSSARWPDIQTIAEDEKVLWIDPILAIKYKSKQQRKTHLGRPSLAQYMGGILPEGEGIVIGVADTGMDRSHACFYVAGYELPSTETQSVQCGPHPKVCAINTAKPGITDYQGEDGAHGMSTAGAAACADTGLVVGMATQAKVLFYDMTKNGSDEELELPLIDGPGIRTFWEWLREATSLAYMTVISMSWGANTRGRIDSVSYHADLFGYENPYVLQVAAAGNNQNEPDPLNRLPTSPCNGANVLCVGALVGPDTVASFSSRGTVDGRAIPQVYSPGVNEILAFGYKNPVAGHYTPHTGSGTSYSAPGIAGLGARYQNHYKDRHENQTPLNPLVRALLIGSSQPVKTVKDYGVPVITEIGMEESGLFSFGPTAEVAYCYMATAPIAKNITLTAVFLAFPKTPGTSPGLINNLDMKVYKNHHLLFDGRDTMNPTEMYKTTGAIDQGDMLRVVLYESDFSIVGRIHYGFYLGSSLFRRASEDECGVCQSTESEGCDGGNKFCNVTSGVMTRCLPLKNEALGSVHSTQCTTAKYIGFSLNGNCVPYECVDGYYYEQGECKCIAGFRKNGNHVCNTNNVFVVSSELGEEGPSAESEGTVLTANRFLLLLLLTVFFVQ